MGWDIVVLLAGVPAALMGVLFALERLEAWLVRPDERAAAMAELIDSAQEPEEVEAAVARLLAEVAPSSQHDAETPVDAGLH